MAVNITKESLNEKSITNYNTKHYKHGYRQIANHTKSQIHHNRLEIRANTIN